MSFRDDKKNKIISSGESITLQQHGRMVSFFGGPYVLIVNIFVFFMACFAAFQMDYLLRVGLDQHHSLEPWMLFLPFIVALVVRNVFLSFAFLLLYLNIADGFLELMHVIKDGIFEKRWLNQRAHLQAVFYVIALLPLVVYLLVVGIRMFLKWKRS